MAKNKKKKRGMVYMYMGTGAGKTTNALGIAMRCVGHKRKVVVIQFLKWWKKTGEYKVRDRLKPYYEIYQFGRRGWVGFSNIDERDRELAGEGFEFAKKVIARERKRRPDVLVLDEINLALHLKLLDIDKVVEFLKDLPPTTDVVLTGRYPPKKLIDASDFVNEIKDVKYPRKLTARKGIQY